MAVSTEFTKEVLAKFPSSANVIGKPMFGGVGLYAGKAFFGILFRDLLFFRVDQKTLPQYEAEGAQPFRPFTQKPASRSYYEVPTTVYDQPQLFKQWTQLAISAAEGVNRKPAPKSSSKSSKSPAIASMKKKISADEARALLHKHANPAKAKVLARFFKTGPGEYAEGDQFIGVIVPKTREVASSCVDLSGTELKKLMTSKIHEERLLALIILTIQFKRGSMEIKKEIFNFYLASLRHINNWDLVDCSAEHIVGPLYEDENPNLLSDLALSKNLWARRVAMLATFHGIKNNNFRPALRIATMLRDDNEDLIHKAVGWMLREVGKRDVRALETYLQKHYKKMPRTMLRYAIEHFSQPKRKAYLEGRR